MRRLRAAFPWAPTCAAAAAGVGGALAFLGFALAPPGHPFAAVALCLLVAGVVGPWLHAEADPALLPLRCLLVAALAGAVCGFHGAPAVTMGLFCGLYAFASGSVAAACRARLPAGALAAALLATLHLWDALAPFEDPKSAADLAFRLNAAAAASVTLDFDWVHAKALYAGNQTAESLAGVPRRGIGHFSLACGSVAVGAQILAALRRRIAR